MVSVNVTAADRELAAYRVAELKRLALTAGATVVHVCEQNLKSYNSATLIGPGKVDELKALIGEGGVDVALFNHDLTPVQQRNLEKSLGRRVLDRTELILDIFAQRAQSRDGKIQVELAQLRYLRPRLTGRGVELSRLGGGIGTRGPGETKLEVDRRRIGQRIARLRRELEKTRQTRRLQRKGRQRDGMRTLTLVGYTNAGKSSLLNRLTDAEALAKDQLFSTLDTTTRRLLLPNGKRALLSDTVGFISNLPEPLMAAFRATLEVVEEADALVHVMDASSPYLDEHMHAVQEALSELGCADKPMVIVFNKMDLASEENMGRLSEIEARLGVRCERASARLDRDFTPLLEAFAFALDEAARREQEERDNRDAEFNPLDE